MPADTGPVLQRYRNLAGDSGVRGYALLDEGAIAVGFRSGDVYLYTEASCGAGTVARMRRLAESGRGLSGFISQEVGDRYAARLAAPDPAPDED